jgi:uncharacterized protein (DUF488 family)
MILFTIGFTHKTAEQFFCLLQAAGVRRVLDTRLNNRSQLAGFTKANDLRFFLKSVADIGYRYAPEMAPTEEMLDRYKKRNGSWSDYENEYLQLLEQRRLYQQITQAELVDACLLCSEHEPTHCHRRLAAEYLQRHFADLEIVHLS